MIVFNQFGGRFGDFDEWKPPFQLAPSIPGWQSQAPNHPALPMRVAVVREVFDIDSVTPATREEVLTDPFALSGTWQNPPSQVLNFMIARKLKLSIAWQGGVQSGMFDVEIAAGNRAIKADESDSDQTESEHYVDGWLIYNDELIAEGVIAEGEEPYSPTDPRRRFLRYKANSFDPETGDKKPIERRHDGSQEWLRKSHPSQPLGNEDGSIPDIAGIKVVGNLTRVSSYARVDDGSENREPVTVSISNPFGGDEEEIEPQVFEWEVTETLGIKASSADVEYSTAVYITSLNIWLVGVGVSIVQERYHTYENTIPNLYDVFGGPTGLGIYLGGKANRALFPEGAFWDVMVPKRNAQWAAYQQFLTIASEYYRKFISVSGVDRWKTFPASALEESGHEYNTIRITGEAMAVERYPLWQD